MSVMCHRNPLPETSARLVGEVSISSKLPRAENSLLKDDPFLRAIRNETAKMLTMVWSLLLRTALVLKRLKLSEFTPDLLEKKILGSFETSLLYAVANYYELLKKAELVKTSINVLYKEESTCKMESL